jgi:SOS-response transcriptional repressor LexA
MRKNHMKSKKNTAEFAEKSEKPETEEFFQLPRAEHLLDELQQGHARQIGDLITNPPHHLAHRFTLQTNDDHMRGADIRNGDYIVIEKKSSYPEGSILAVKLGEKQLVRRYFRRGGRLHLQCDPPLKQIIIVEEQTPDFQILGQVIQVIREIK